MGPHPVTGLPRTMSVLDALVGQVFLVVLLARLVALYRPLGWRTGLEERLIEERLREERLREDAAGTGAGAER